jgi:CRISPR-associated endonuclease/helicase Cas3
MTTEIPLEMLIRFWAKTTHDRERYPNAYHPLICHMIDVAAVTLVMWEEVLPKAAKKRIARAWGLSTNKDGLELAGRIVAWIAGLHDLGKASPPFALRSDSQSAIRLHQLYQNTLFSPTHLRVVPAASDAPHGYVTAKTLPEILSREFQLPPTLARRIGILIGGHHGIFPRSQQIIALSTPSKLGTDEWSQSRRCLALKLAETFDLSMPLPRSPESQFDGATTMFLSGLVSVADWIGSNSAYFKCLIDDSHSLPEFNPQSYLDKARSYAEKALGELGWMNWPPPDHPRQFDRLFPSLINYRAVQRAAIAIAEKLVTPGIAVIEAPMGEGKTEAAMFLADHWNAMLGQRGIYFAMPTQATSNQMFQRVRKFLKARFDENLVLLQLLHGHAALSSEFATLLKEGAKMLQLDHIHDDDGCRDRHCEGNVAAAEWFTHRKRGLLAPYGVGTVDQALMAVLQTRHVFVRLFGLAHKTVIIDEVHAYDAYMSTLLERLLEWLAALGSPVVLLSATLPKSKRRKLLQAYAKGLGKPSDKGHSDDGSHYPLITWTAAHNFGVQPIETSTENSRMLHLRWLDGDIDGDEFEIGRILREQLSGGGCAAVICNTVDRAQQVYARLEKLFPGQAHGGRDRTDLLHARFLFKDRAERELRALVRFGKNGEKIRDRSDCEHEVKRPDCAILVSTQIIEQSLDLDFDLIITDLAPVDLLLQRAGREWRHQRSQRGAITQPILWICRPEKIKDGVPDFGYSGLVYDKHILLCSWLALRSREAINIPAEVEELIESVYDDDRACPDDVDENLREFWEKTKAKMLSKREEKEQNAKVFRILSPHDPNLMEDFNLELEEDSPEYHRSRQAATRDDDTPSIPVVMLKPDEAHLLKTKPDLKTVKQLLERSVNIVKRGAVQELIALDPPGEWKDSPLLRHHRLLKLDERSHSQPLSDWLFRLDADLGVVIKKSNKEKADA